MGPYSKIRFAPPRHEHRSQRRAERELEEQRQEQEKRAAFANEESERLLSGELLSGEGLRGCDDAPPREFSAARSPYRKWLRLPHNKWLRLVFVVAAGAAFLWAAVSLLCLAANAEAEHRTVKQFRRPSAEYIVPRDWNFDAPKKARYHRWTITDITANPDGVFRPMTVINGKFPGPMIVCNEGDTIVVDVINYSQNATSIHWHGLFQNGTNFMDGAVGVTQCPIAPGQSFRYQFKVTGQAGTYFYHGHHGAQSQDGLSGPLVILSRDERQAHPFGYDSDRVIMIQDWYHDPSPGLLREALSPGSENPPIPNGALINGRNKVDCSLHRNRHCDNSTTQWPTFDFAPNKRHRLRIINVGAFGWFEVSVDKHLKLPVTEVDGVVVQPQEDTTLLVGPGQRYSVLLASSEKLHSGLFWFRARMMTHCFSENVLPENGVAEAKAILRYDRGKKSQFYRKNHISPSTEADSGNLTVVCKDKAPGVYQPRHQLAAPEYAHHSWYFRLNLEIGAWRLQRGFLNQSSFRPQLPSPTLHRLLDGLNASSADFQIEGVNDVAFDATSELVVSAQGVETVDIILQNFDEGNHPFHLHGAQMFILAAGHGYFPGYEALGLQPEGKGLLNPDEKAIIANPTRRDVTTIESFGWTLIRFVADNPGVWLFHCHMIWHGEAGMGMQFASRLDIMKDWTIPEQNARLCKAPPKQLEKGAAPKDEIWFGNFG